MNHRVLVAPEEGLWWGWMIAVVLVSGMRMSQVSSLNLLG